jgi:hypothetical protein
MPLYYLNTVRSLLVENVFNKYLVTKALNDFSLFADDEQIYDKVVISLFASTSLCNEFTKKNNLQSRILGTLADGTVFFDSSFLDKNTYQNYKSQIIGQNHASRSSIRQAMDSLNGEGWETKYSATNNNTFEEYYALRTGTSKNDIGLVIRLSVFEIKSPETISVLDVPNSDYYIQAVNRYNDPIMPTESRFLNFQNAKTSNKIIEVSKKDIETFGTISNYYESKKEDVPIGIIDKSGIYFTPNPTVLIFIKNPILALKHFNKISNNQYTFNQVALITDYAPITSNEDRINIAKKLLEYNSTLSSVYMKYGEALNMDNIVADENDVIFHTKMNISYLYENIESTLSITSNKLYLTDSIFKGINSNRQLVLRSDYIEEKKIFTSINKI